MAGSSSNQDVFDVGKIRRLVALMKEHDLSELDLREGDKRIQLRRGAEVPVGEVPVGVVGQPALAAREPAPRGGQDEQAAEADVKADSPHIVEIRSPMVGTFYSSSDPDSPAYAKVGDHVGPDTTVCIVEAMKVFNQITADVSGKILAVLIENGEPVGILTESDAVDLLTQSFEGALWNDIPVNHVMSSPVISVSMGVSIIDAIAITQGGCIRAHVSDQIL